MVDKTTIQEEDDFDGEIQVNDRAFEAVFMDNEDSNDESVKLIDMPRMQQRSMELEI